MGFGDDSFYLPIVPIDINGHKKLNINQKNRPAS